MRFVVFLDALDQKDILSSPWLTEKMKCGYNPGVPKVTPNVISQIMTGQRREDLPFMRSTPYKKPRVMHIEDKTILHYAAEEQGLRVFQYGIPLCSQIQLPDGSISTYDHFIHQGQAIPAVLQFAKNNVDYMKADSELIFHALVDETQTQFSTLRTIARNGNFDIMFWGYTFIDALTHWYNEESRRRLIYYVGEELKDLNRYGDILFFSDHGSTEQKKVFFVNKFLYEKGYLKYEIYEKLMNFHEAYSKQFPDQILLQHQHVYIDWNDSKFYSTDAFDAMIDVTDKATEEDKQKLKAELMETGYFNSVSLKEEILDKDGKCYELSPGIICDAAEGVLVSTNIHENAESGKNMDNLRGGWHSDRGVFGSTTDIRQSVTCPRDIYYAMCEFVRGQKPEVKKVIDPEEAEILGDDLVNLMDQLGYQ